MVPIPGAYTNQDYSHYTMGKIHWSVRGRESTISDPVLFVFMRGGMECDSVHVSVEGQSKADMCVNWVVCVRCDIAIDPA